MLPARFPRSRFALTAAAALPLAVAAMALWVRSDPASPPFQGLDDAWLRLMGGPHDEPLWTAAESFNRFGGRVGPAVAFLIAAALAALRRWWSALYSLTAVSATYVAVDLLKAVGERDRPAEPLIAVASDAFPSGHSARMASVVVVLTVVSVGTARRWWWPPAALLVGAMMWSRTWQHAHWLTDTVAGAALGVGVSMLCWRAFDPLLRRERQRREAAALARNRDAPSASNALP